MSHQNEKLWTFRPKTVPVRSYRVPAHRRRPPLDPRVVAALKRRFSRCLR